MTGSGASPTTNGTPDFPTQPPQRPSPQRSLEQLRIGELPFQQVSFLKYAHRARVPQRKSYRRARDFRMRVVRLNVMRRVGTEADVRHKVFHRADREPLVGHATKAEVILPGVNLVL